MGDRGVGNSRSHEHAADEAVYNDVVGFDSRRFHLYVFEYVAWIGLLGDVVERVQHTLLSSPLLYSTPLDPTHHYRIRGDTAG